LKDHFFLCRRVPVNCPVVGCTAKMAREVLEQHMAEAASAHVVLLVEYNKQLMTVVERLTEENYLLKRRDLELPLICSDNERKMSEFQEVGLVRPLCLVGREASSGVC